MSLFPFWSHRSGSPGTWPVVERWTETGPVELESYGAALYEYAEPRIDTSSLYAWMVQRLIVDGEVDHATAVRIVDEVLAGETRSSNVRAGRRLAERASYVHRPSLHRLSR